MYNNEITTIKWLLQDLNERTERYLDNESDTIPELTIMWNGHRVDVTMETPETNTATVDYLRELLKTYKNLRG